MSRAKFFGTLSSLPGSGPALGPRERPHFLYGAGCAARIYPGKPVLLAPFFLGEGRLRSPLMLLFIIKAAISGFLVAAISLVAKRYPGWGGLIASLPLVSVLSMLWLYGETRDAEKVAALSTGAFWFFLPSIPMFLLIPALIRQGVSFGVTMIVACLTTIALYAGMSWLAPRLGIAL